MYLIDQRHIKNSVYNNRLFRLQNESIISRVLHINHKGFSHQSKCKQKYKNVHDKLSFINEILIFIMKQK